MIQEVDVLHWYGQKPDREEIKNSVKAGQDSGYRVADKVHYCEEVDGEVLHVMVLYFENIRRRLG